MAISLRCLLRNNFKLFNGNILPTVSHNVTRSIYTPAAMGLDNYMDLRKNITNQFQSVSETFRAKMTEFTTEDNKSLIFTEDLKAMLHIVENKEDDINLTKKMIKKFHSQNNELRFGNYIFGPVVMRTCYYLDNPDMALQLFKDPQLDGFFDQLTSYQILMALLLKHEKYLEMREVYDVIRNKNTGNVVYPYNSTLLLIIGCYKENTKESFDYVLNVWSDLAKKGFESSRKTTCLMALLSINQGKPEYAIEFISNFPQFRHIEVRCTKIEAYLAHQKFTDIYQFLSKILQSDRFVPGSSRPLTFFKDTIEHLEEALTKAGPGNEDLTKLVQEIRNRNLVQDLTLVGSILKPIEKRIITEKDEGNDNFDATRTFRGTNKRNLQQNSSQSRVTMRRY